MSGSARDVQAAMAAGDWPRAIKIASSFPELGMHKAAIQRAHACNQNPRLYDQLPTYDRATVEAEGIAALRTRFDKPHTAREAAARVEEVLSKLEVLPERHSDIPQHAWNLSLVSFLWRHNDSPQTRAVGTTTTQRELKKFADLAAKLGCHIKSMHNDARDAYHAASADRPNLDDMPAELMYVILAVDKALGQLGPEKPARRQQPKKQQADNVSVHAAQVFTALTGKPATRINDTVTDKVGGQFYNFLAELFVALGIDASAASQVRGRAI